MTDDISQATFRTIADNWENLSPEQQQGFRANWKPELDVLLRFVQDRYTEGRELLRLLNMGWLRYSPFQGKCFATPLGLDTLKNVYGPQVLSGCQIETEQPSELQQIELDALLLERAAVIRVVSALRQYRAEVTKMLDRRYGDGEVDGCTLGSFADAIKEIENPSEDQEYDGREY